MRVGLDARWYNDSGVGTYVAQLLRALVPLQCANSQQQKPAAGQETLELVVYDDPRNPVPGLRPDAVRRVPLSTGKYSPASQFELRLRCKQDGLDLLHIPFYPIPLWAPCPVVVTLHDLIPFLFHTDHALKRLAVQWGYRIAAARSSRIIAVSRHTADDISRILKTPAEKINVVHNGVSREDFHARRDPGEIAYLAERYGIHSPYVMAASAWNWQTKNLISALKALSLARKQLQREFQTVVYGPPQGLQASGGAAAWKDLNLVQTGHLAAADLARLFRNAHCFLMPALYEGFGLPVLEAMACGCAVITSKSGSLAEVAGTGAQTFDPLDIEGMARAVISLLSNPAELKLWQERGLGRAAEFSWYKVAQETIAVYRRAVGFPR